MGHGAVIEADNYDGILEKLTDFPLLQGTPHAQSMQTNTQVLLNIWAPESFTLSDYAGISEELHERLSGNLDLSSGFSVWGKPNFRVVLFVNQISK